MGNIGNSQRCRRNRHHLLYPRRAWQYFGKEALAFRGKFIIKINTGLHAELHHEIDPLLGDNVGVTMLPDVRTLKYLELAYQQDKIIVKQMKPAERIDWLVMHVGRAKRNRWLRHMLLAQKRFLETHKEEI